MTEKKIINPVLDKMVDSNGIYNRRRKNKNLEKFLKLLKRVLCRGEDKEIQKMMKTHKNT